MRGGDVMYLEIGAPEAEPVTLEEAKRHLRLVDTIITEIEPEEPGGEPTIITSHPDDDYIKNLIRTAREWGEAFQGRSWITRTVTAYLNEWPSYPLKLPMGPVQEVVSISYFTLEGVEVEVDPSTYWLSPDGVLYGKGWPFAPLRERLGVKIVYKAGYGDASAVPMRCKQAMLLMIGHWYENREEVIIGVSSSGAAQIPAAAEMLLYQEREIPI